MRDLVAIVLGSAAGGGVPQWNCRCRVCELAWAGDARVRTRTQTSIAVSADREHWVLLNVSPDLRTQIINTSALHPRGAIRGSPIKTVILTGAEIDQIAGLLHLREQERFEIIATPEILLIIESNPIFRALSSDLTPRRSIALDALFELPGGLRAEFFAVPGKAPLFLESETVDTISHAGGNVGVEIAVGQEKRLAFVPTAAKITPALRERLSRCDLLLFDGAVFHDDELIAAGAGAKSGRRMGHVPIEGFEGSLSLLADLRTRRRYIHINNTNPILIDGSPERRRVEAAGWRVTEDGEEIVL